jgi:hypothetical protein
MSDSFNTVSCEDLRELANESPEEARVIKEMLLAAGVECPEMNDSKAVDTTH